MEGFFFSRDDSTIAKLAAAVCVGKEGLWMADANHPEIEKGYQTAINSGHLGILEHIYFTFLIKDVSRSLTLQLVRHRIASYAQQSQRYCKINTDTMWYITPSSYNVTYKHGASFTLRYVKLMQDIAEFYNDAVDCGIPKEDARYVLPNSCHTTIVCSMNARSFIEQCKLRLCSRAQWEIRELYHLIHKKVSEVHPEIAALAVPPCVNGKCQEVKPCKTPYRC